MGRALPLSITFAPALHALMWSDRSRSLADIGIPALPPVYSHLTSLEQLSGHVLTKLNVTSALTGPYQGSQ
jgi:hypothetical protein